MMLSKKMPRDSDAIKYTFNYALTWCFQKVLPIGQLHATPDRQKYALRVLNSLSQEPQPFRIFQRKDERHHRLLHHRFISAAAQVD